jgi:hypothetical protein
MTMTIKEVYDPVILTRSIAYCKGFVDAFDEGIQNNPYDGGSFNQNEITRHLHYKWGYDAGINEYCNATHPEE